MISCAPFPSEVQIGANINCTALVYDIKDYTSLSEKMSLSVTAKIIKTVFTPVLEILNNNQVDHFSFSGDGILAIFYDEVSANYAACKSVKTANEIAQLTESLSGALKDILDEPISFGIGIRTGPGQVIRVGNRQTIIGDTVNVANRLQGYTRLIDQNILIDGTTARLVEDIEPPKDVISQYRFFDYVFLKGRIKPLETFCPI